MRVMTPTRTCDTDDPMGLSVIIREEIEERPIRALGYVDGTRLRQSHESRFGLPLPQPYRAAGSWWRGGVPKHAQNPNAVQVNMQATGEPFGMTLSDRARGAAARLAAKRRLSSKVRSTENHHTRHRYLRGNGRSGEW